MSKEIPVISYTRTVGYFAPFNNVNKGKQEEIKERKLFDVNNKKKNYPRWKKDLTLSEV